MLVHEGEVPIIRTLLRHLASLLVSRLDTNLTINTLAYMQMLKACACSQLTQRLGVLCAQHNHVLWMCMLKKKKKRDKILALFDIMQCMHAT